ncbi:MAG: site-specific DNA-methyltransferase [Myxococcota bacterium]|nr:site-specific DNA-methyltransferase [Myxococcota bacterium]
MKRRRSLTHVGGPVETTGDPPIAALLAHALDVAPPSAVASESGGGRPIGEDDADRVHVHGFHTYPARMHPFTAARLVAAASQAGQTLLDPFCGSGTVLVEAMIAGRQATGTDLNPLAIRLARLKTTPRATEARHEIVAAAQSIAAMADERRKQRAGSSCSYPREDVATFDPHVLLELDSLRAGIRGLRGGPSASTVREALELVLSAILLKVSRKASDTSDARAPRRIAGGYPARLFARKAQELSRRLAEFAALVGPDAKPARVTVDDAARLRTVAAGSVDAVVTSPPYVATYDYLAHHALRMRWLAIDSRELHAGEMGARRRYATLDPRAAHDAWSRELEAMFREMARVCRKGGRVVLLLADSAVRGQALRADAMVAAVAPKSGLRFVARASQRRPHFHGPTADAFRRLPRAEHAIALEKR